VHFREPALPQGRYRHRVIGSRRRRHHQLHGHAKHHSNATTRTALLDKYLLAAGRARANFAFYLGGANDNLDEIRAIRPEQTCGLKLFMGASTGNMLVDDPATLEKIFADCPVLIATHCEDSAHKGEQARLRSSRR
jgi:dihydroorotase